MVSIMCGVPCLPKRDCIHWYVCACVRRRDDDDDEASLLLYRDVRCGHENHPSSLTGVSLSLFFLSPCLHKKGGPECPDGLFGTLFGFELCASRVRLETVSASCTNNIGNPSSSSQAQTPAPTVHQKRHLFSLWRTGTLGCRLSAQG